MTGSLDKNLIQILVATLKTIASVTKQLICYGKNAFENIKLNGRDLFWSSNHVIYRFKNFGALLLWATVYLDNVKTWKNFGKCEQVINLESETFMTISWKFQVSEYTNRNLTRKPKLLSKHETNSETWNYIYWNITETYLLFFKNILILY